ncbi:hypothetical protein K458DRAFT_457190 [Lentithecium fluviatile CBS 122367]|uniref:NACHT domain-containing protein n=1 Tax=Lentithecium fluviatile CBS 122367 TaxID=1168545 RepID=A0A6G1ITI9_9PLEO|nr:hypothetical protein K458DRAFT_457190 [Lentithecium fluviatile CBS 122367]
MLDALDEVAETFKCEILKFIRNATSKGIKKLHLLVTSRDEANIRTAMSHTPHITIHIAEEDVDANIRTYVRSCLSEPTERLSGLSDVLKSEIDTKVVDGTRVMFRWAVCQIDILKQCRKARDIKDTLRQLPTTLHVTYVQILGQINERDYEDTFSILQWLAFSKCPLTLTEIAEAAVKRPN